MKPLIVNVPHELGRDEARRRIDEGFGQLQRQITPSLGSAFVWNQRWEDDRLHVEAKGLGQTLTGRLDVTDDAVRIEIDLPALLVGLADRIRGRLRDTGRKLLEKR